MREVEEVRAHQLIFDEEERRKEKRNDDTSAAEQMGAVGAQAGEQGRGLEIVHARRYRSIYHSLCMINDLLVSLFYNYSM